MTALTCAVIGVVSVVLWGYRYGTIISPDGRVYIAMAHGAQAPSPFRWRLAPRLLGRCPVVWRWSSWGALVGAAVLVGLYAEQQGLPGWAAASLFCALPWFRGLVRMPLLTDQLGMFLALAGALVPWPFAIPLWLLAGACSERSVVFAAVFAWNPLALVGLLVPMSAAILTPRGPEAEHNDWQVMRQLHNRARLAVYVLPWGACLLAVLAPSWQLAAAVGLGYAQMAIATDRARIYMAGAPVVVVTTLAAVPAWSWPLLILAMVVNPASEWEAPWK